MSRLWIVRHGETDYNRDRRMQGHLDVPLNETGLDQAKDTAARIAIRFADEEPPPIYTSDLRRAAQTALAIGRALQVRPRVARKLRERAFGIMEGKTFDEFAETHPTEAHAYRRGGDKDAIPDAEAFAEFTRRSLRAFRAIARREERAIVVTHGGLLKVLLRAVFGPDTQFLVANTALYTFDVDPHAKGAAGFQRVLEEEEAVSSARLDPVR